MKRLNARVGLPWFMRWTLLKVISLIFHNSPGRCIALLPSLCRLDELYIVCQLLWINIFGRMHARLKPEWGYQVWVCKKLFFSWFVFLVIDSIFWELIIVSGFFWRILTKDIFLWTIQRNVLYEHIYKYWLFCLKSGNLCYLEIVWIRNQNQLTNACITFSKIKNIIQGQVFT